MGRLQQVTQAIAFAGCVAFGGGCVNTRPAGDMQPGAALPKKAPEVTVAREADATAGVGKIDPNLLPAAAKAPATIPTPSITAFAKSASKDAMKGGPTEISVAWQNKVAQLPDPTRNGSPIHGVVGQLFLFGADFKPAPANGQLVVEMYDITPRPGAAADGPRLGTWTFDKDTLKKFVTMDERFGKCYAIFLPWPDYNPNVGRVKLKVRFDPERGYPLFSPEAPLTFDTGTNSATLNRTVTTNPGLSPAGGFGNIPASVTPPNALPPLDPLPVGGRNAPTSSAATPGAGTLPPNLPPLVITAGR